MATSKPPTSTWADKPMRLVTTPQYETRKKDIFTTGATHMALVHNTIIRGFNSIYLQAPHLQETDKEGFVGYALAWYRFVKAHHDDEDQNLFLKVENVLEDKSIFTLTYNERRAILPGLEEYYLYLSSLTSPTKFAGSKLVKILELFREAFEAQLHREVTTIASLATHPRLPAEGTSQLKAATSAFKSWEKNIVKMTGVTDIMPFFMMNLDRTFEGGLWNNWPPLSMSYKWGLMNLGGSWNGDWWLFTSCDADGKPQQLHALRP